MPGRDVVVGASAGGVEGLTAFVAGLPADLRAAVLVVLHMPATASTALPRILGRAGPLPVHPARHGDSLEPGTVVTAIPDHHLLVADGALQVVIGPREIGYRPAVDALFRSAPLAYGPRVLGVVLSGALDDGTAGLSAIKARGGLAMVQDPEEAVFPSMPRNAIQGVSVDYCLPARDMGRVIGYLTDGTAEPTEHDVARQTGGNGAGHQGQQGLEVEQSLVVMNPRTLATQERPGQLSGFGCPGCGGVLREIEDGERKRFRCRVGHSYTEQGLLAQMSDGVEQALWVALRALEEKHELSRRLVARATAGGQHQARRRFEEAASAVQQQAETVRRLLLQGATPVPHRDGPADQA